MSLDVLLQAAYAADPIACYVAAAAIALVVVAFPFRRGGIDARYIIQVFATLATIGTVPRIMLWGAAHLIGSPTPPALSGTDCVLAAGGLIAIVYSGTQELIVAFVGERKDESLAVKGWRAIAAKVFPKWFPRATEQIEETPEAAADRARMEAVDKPGSGGPQ